MLNSTTLSSAVLDLSVLARISEPRQEVLLTGQQSQGLRSEVPATRFLKSSGFSEVLHAGQTPAISPPHFIPKQRSCVCLPPGLRRIGEHWYLVSDTGGEGVIPPGSPGTAATDMASATTCVSLTYCISLQTDNTSGQKKPLGRGTSREDPQRTPAGRSQPLVGSARRVGTEPGILLRLRYQPPQPERY